MHILTTKTFLNKKNPFTVNRNQRHMSNSIFLLLYFSENFKLTNSQNNLKQTLFKNRYLVN